jgi:hypothetical protein
MTFSLVPDQNQMRTRQNQTETDQKDGQRIGETDKRANGTLQQ